MTEHIASTMIIVPNWALYAMLATWAISIGLDFAKLILERVKD